MRAPPREPAEAPRAERTRSPIRLPNWPFLPFLFVLVIAMTAGLVALLLLPTVAGIGFGVNQIRARLQAEGAGCAGACIPHFPQRSTIFARNGTVLATVYLDENRKIVRLKNVSRYAQDAVLAIEDHDFYHHGPFNPSSVIRAMLANIVAGHVVQGGSTITQQLVKNTLIQDPAETIQRKLQELALAARVEAAYSKDQILEMYLNEVYLGNGVYGIGTAAEFYYREKASELTLSQAATLAGLIQLPQYFEPLDHPRRAALRRNEVLDRMAELGLAPQSEVDAIKLTPVKLPPGAGRQIQKKLPFIAYFAKQQILENANHEFDALGKKPAQRVHTLFQGGLKIYTTFDPTWQRYAQDAVLAHLPKTHKAPDASIVTVDARTGAIRAMLSGKDYARDELDLAWRGRRQVGSAFKPYTLVAAFRQGIPPTTVYNSHDPFCSPIWISRDHCVHNAEPGGGGYVDLWTATQHSINVVFAQLALDVGPENIVTAAHDMGVTAPLDAVPSITLGAEEVSTLDMATGYSTLANDGKHCEPYAIQRVLLPGGDKLYSHHVKCKQVVEPTIAHLVTAMLQRVVTGGTGTAAAIPGRPIAGKTGTGQDHTNVYFAGYTPQYATAVWVGFPGGNVPLENYYGYSVFGGTVAAPIWHDYMVRILQGVPIEGFEAPPAPPRGQVPKVVGMTAEEAQRTLAAARFSSKVVKVNSAEPKGTVVAQSPGAGTNLVLGSLVEISVSTGHPPKTVVPDVVGMTKADALAALRAAGLKPLVVMVDVTDVTQKGIVQTQTPAAGDKVPERTVVTIEVGKVGP